MAVRYLKKPDLTHCAVPVLGMHRAGTSMLTRMLRALGVELGAALQGPAADNPRGFWEHRFFQQVNMRLLSGLGCDPDGLDDSARLLAAAAGAERYARPMSDAIGRFIAQHFGGGMWGFKDPRTCVTWDFWSATFAHVGIRDVRPVVVLRAPQDCARSLVKRGDHLRRDPSCTADRAYAEHLRLWSDYYSLLERSVPDDALWLSQADLIDPATAPYALAACCDYLGLPHSGIAPALATVDGGLAARGATSEPVMATEPRDAAQCDAGQCETELRDAEQQYANLLRRTRREPSEAHAYAGWAPQQAPGAPDCIYVASPAGYPHSQAFEEVARMLHHGLRDLGICAPIVYEPFELGAAPLVLGPQLLTGEGAPEVTLPASAILFNLEQLADDSPWCTPAYKQLLGRHRVWDYSERNLERLRAWGVSGARLCELGFHECLQTIEPLPDDNRDIDVLLYGTLGPRRRQVLEGLDRAGLRTVHLFGIYGAERDALIARAKVCLNIHHYAAQVLEVVRVSYLLHNRVCVVSEPDGTDADHWLHDGLWLAEYEGLVSACQQAATDGARRSDQANAGLASVRKRPITRSLQTALGIDDTCVDFATFPETG